MPAVAVATHPVAPAWAARRGRDADTGGIGTPANRAAHRRVGVYLEGSLDGPWQVWNSAEIAVWSKVRSAALLQPLRCLRIPILPHIVALAGYRRHITVTNPYPKGRTILHFAGAGQTDGCFFLASLI